MALSADTIATSIAALTITGVTIKDLDGIPTQVDARDCPILYPRPNNWITDFRAVRKTFGSGNYVDWDVSYTLNYIYLHAPITVERSQFAAYKSLVQAAQTILLTIMRNDAISGAIDMRPLNLNAFDPVVDPAGNLFHGCDIAIDIMEFEDS